MTIQEQSILLVEDDDNDAELISMAFNRSKIRNPLIRVRDGVEALAYLFGQEGHREKNDLPAVILLDLDLPRISGVEVLKQVRANEHTQYLPIVILTPLATARID